RATASWRPAGRSAASRRQADRRPRKGCWLSKAYGSDRRPHRNNRSGFSLGLIPPAEAEDDIVLGIPVFAFAHRAGPAVGRRYVGRLGARAGFAEAVMRDEAPVT